MIFLFDLFNPLRPTFMSFPGQSIHRELAWQLNRHQLQGTLNLLGHVLHLCAYKSIFYANS